MASRHGLDVLVREGRDRGTVRSHRRRARPATALHASDRTACSTVTKPGLEGGASRWRTPRRSVGGSPASAGSTLPTSSGGRRGACSPPPSSDARRHDRLGGRQRRRAPRGRDSAGRPHTGRRGLRSRGAELPTSSVSAKDLSTLQPRLVALPVAVDILDTQTGWVPVADRGLASRPCPNTP